MTDPQFWFFTILITVWSIVNVAITATWAREIMNKLDRLR